MPLNFLELALAAVNLEKLQVPCILETIAELNEKGSGIIVTTAEDFSEIPFFEDQESWILITDQALEKVDSFNRSSFCNQAVLTDYIEVEQQTHWNQYQLKLKDKDSIRSNDENVDLLRHQF